MDKDARTILEMNLLNEVQGFHLERHLESEDCEKYRPFSDIDDREVLITWREKLSNREILEFKRQFSSLLEQNKDFLPSHRGGNFVEFLRKC